MIPKNMSRMNSVSKIDVKTLAKNTNVNEKTVNKDNWRASMLSKLNKEQIWLSPANKPKNHQTVIIFDWDDTLLPTTFLIPF